MLKERPRKTGGVLFCSIIAKQFLLVLLNVISNKI